jgi:four helix bundle protein
VRSEFRDLAAYQRAAALAVELHKAVPKWPPLERWTIGPQVLRSAGSIGANIAEAAGRYHRGDRRRFLLTARGSLLETEHWLLLAGECNLPGADCIDALQPVARALAGLIARHSD